MDALCDIAKRVYLSGKGTRGALWHPSLKAPKGSPALQPCQFFLATGPVADQALYLKKIKRKDADESHTRRVGRQGPLLVRPMPEAVGRRCGRLRRAERAKPRARGRPMRPRRAFHLPRFGRGPRSRASRLRPRRDAASHSRRNRHADFCRRPTPAWRKAPQRPVRGRPTRGGGWHSSRRCAHDHPELPIQWLAAHDPPSARRGPNRSGRPTRCLALRQLGRFAWLSIRHRARTCSSPTWAFTTST